MALKRQQNVLAAFSMASMTDVIFLLLVFFMVTSTFVFPTALDINLPQSSEQTPVKPITRVYIDQQGQLYAAYDNAEPQHYDSLEALTTYLLSVNANATDNAIAIYADVEVPYGKIVEVLNIGAANNLKMVLATSPKPSQAASAPTTTDTPSTEQTQPQP